MGSWLDGGPNADGSGDGRLGLPAEGPGSRATTGRRIVALGVDWVLSTLVNYLAFVAPAGLGFLDIAAMPTLAVFALENVLLVGTLGFTVGHRVVGIRVLALGAPGRMVGLVRAFVRTFLLCLVIPAVVWDGDGRGLHDRAAGTVIVRF